MHSLDYPIFFSCLDIDEISTVGWSLWPIFKLDSGWTAFCSLQNSEHLKGWTYDKQGRFCFSGSSLSRMNEGSLSERVRSFVGYKSNNKLTLKTERISLLTHLSYFGYCFNPISVYYIREDDTDADVAMIIAEVSNTPWIEQHSYLLHEHGQALEIIRNVAEKSFEATWNKEFHVSPFMEMDYQYKFTFSKPGEKIWVRARMLKLITNEVWFTASFEMDRIAFTPENLLYVLIFYPFHTRLIQVWIHWEALKIWLKGKCVLLHC